MSSEEKSSKTAITPWTSFLWWLSTADASTLKECPTEHERYRIIGLSVLVTWIFATIAWGYFFSTMLDDDFIVYGLALFFGFAIMTIDRNLIAAMSKKEGNSWLPFTFRIVLAITIGLFISQPIVLMLFRKDIATQMELNKEKKLQQFRQETTALNAPVVQDLNQHIQSLQDQLQQKQDEVKSYEDGYIQETDGTGGSGRIGEKAIARVKKLAYQNAAQQYADLKKQDGIQIAVYQGRLDSIADARKQKEASYTATFTNGFLAQIEALSDLTANHPPVRSRYRLIIFIITLIEVMPVLSKLLLPKGVYDEKLSMQNQQDVHNALLSTEKEKALQKHFQEQSLEADKRSIDEFFEQSASVKKLLAEDVIAEPLNGSGTYTTLWKKYRERVFGKKEM